MALPLVMKSLNNISPGKADIQMVPLPKVTNSDRLLVRVTAVGLNPTDWKHIEFTSKGGLRTGCDYAGVVEEVGSKVSKAIQKGDRVAGVTHGSNQSNPDDGAFAEFIAVKGDLAIKIPPNISNEQAASLGVGISTVGQCLYQTLKVPLPKIDGPPPATSVLLLIYGGSTATAILGIQFAKLSGCSVVVTCSPRHFDLVKSLGADGVFDYHLPTTAAEIRKFTQGRLHLAWDCIANPETANFCVSAMAEGEEGQYVSLGPVDDAVVHAVNPRVINTSALAYTTLGERFEKFGMTFNPRVDDYEYGKMFWELARELLARGDVHPAKLKVNHGGKGLEGVMVGLQDMKEGKVSGPGFKLVYSL